MLDVKTPKLHFHDSGMACYLLRIRSPDELRHHPLRGAIFESWVQAGERALLLEAKSGETVSSDAFDSLDQVAAVLARARKETTAGADPGPR